MSLERAVGYYGITMPEIRRIGTEVRTSVLPHLRASRGDRGSGARHPT